VPSIRLQEQYVTRWCADLGEGWHSLHTWGMSGMGKSGSWGAVEELRLFNACIRDDEPLVAVELDVGVGGAMCKGLFSSHVGVPSSGVRTGQDVIPAASSKSPPGLFLMNFQI
jgi:hypothetical protein